ncbi:trypsin-like peptidase domain-containing protein [bacterium]|nr:trypsin-like peptidase domain-containing protein [bacterium]
MKKIILIVLFTCSLNNLFSQVVSKVEMINYFDSEKQLDPIEGLWSLNVIRTLYYHDDVIAQETEEILSEWGIKQVNKLRFKVINIGEGSPEDNENFDAYFESSAIDGFYSYRCNFKNPDWIAKTNAELTNGFVLEYSFFVSEIYMKTNYKKNYRPGLRLKWEFIWTKKYPKLNSSKVSEKNQNEWSGNGTVFFISKDGYLATNYHVVADAKEVEIEFIRNGQKLNYRARIIQSDKQNDLTILKIDDESFSPFSSIPYNFKTTLTDVGSNVFALGYPMALSVMGTEIKFTDGKISSKTGYQGDISTYQMTTPIQAGNSGGPLFDFDGNLIGINSAKIRSDVADNVSYAIKTSYLMNLVNVLPKTLILPNDKTISEKTLTEKIKIISDYVVLIRVK